MRITLNIVTILLLVLFTNCSQQAKKPKNLTDFDEDISINSYLFITDTSQIRGLVRDKVSPSGFSYDVNKLVNHFVKISLTNNLSDTIFLSKIYSQDLASTDSLILAQWWIVRYSQDSINWQRPSDIADHFTAFNEPVLSNKTTDRYLFIENLNDSRYFEFAINYRLDSAIKRKNITVKL